ncbi:ADP-ribose glycohydrolase ARH3 [Balamuthia mandrillaris]
MSLLPRLPSVGPHLRGPTPRSNWVIPGRLLAGAYPGDRKEPQHTEVVHTLVNNAGVQTFVCLQTAKELGSFRDYKPIAKAANPSVSFLHFPIQDGAVGEDEEVVQLVERLSRLIKEERNVPVYVHCWGGHGRTGTIIALLIANLYQVGSEEALSRTGKYHNSRLITNRSGLSPQTPVQFEQVRRITSLVFGLLPEQTLKREEEEEGENQEEDHAPSSSVEPPPPPTLPPPSTVKQKEKEGEAEGRSSLMLALRYRNIDGRFKEEAHEYCSSRENERAGLVVKDINSQTRTVWFAFENGKSFSVEYAKEPYTFSSDDDDLEPLMKRMNNFCGRGGKVEVREILDTTATLYVEMIKYKVHLERRQQRISQELTNWLQHNQQRQQSFPDSIHDASRGCILGALCGDAIGAVLEGFNAYEGRKIAQEDVERALLLPGGGIHHVAPAQITDDGELTLCLAQGLVDMKKSHENEDVTECKLAAEKIATRYADWIQSKPFDVGNITRKTIGCIKMREGKKVAEKEGFAAAMRKATFSNVPVTSNGGLMRISPVGIWGHRLTEQELHSLCKLDHELSHRHRDCIDAAAAYVIAIAYLISTANENNEQQQEERHKAAFLKAEKWALENASENVREWLKRAKELQGAHNEEGIDEEGKEEEQKTYFGMPAGAVGVAFIHAFCHLWRGSSYYDAIKETISCGGDTDTTACIVGGMIGALQGAAKGIPPVWRNALLRQGAEDCDWLQGMGHPRPPFLDPSVVLPAIVDRLLSQAPSALNPT